MLFLGFLLLRFGARVVVRCDPCTLRTRIVRRGLFRAVLGSRVVGRSITVLLNFHIGGLQSDGRLQGHCADDHSGARICHHLNRTVRARLVELLLDLRVRCSCHGHVPSQLRCTWLVACFRSHLLPRSIHIQDLLQLGILLVTIDHRITLSVQLIRIRIQLNQH